MITIQQRQIPIGKKKIAGYLLLSCTFILLGYFLIVFSSNPVGWLLIGFFTMGSVFFAALLLPGSSYLMLAPEGLVRCHLFRSRLYRWQDIQGFAIAELWVKWTKIEHVAFNYTDAFKRLHPSKEAFLKSSFQCDEAFPNHYALSSKELLHLLREWHGRYSSVVYNPEIEESLKIKQKPMSLQALLITILLIFVLNSLPHMIPRNQDRPMSKISSVDAMLETVQRKIRQHWHPPVLPGDHTVTVRFTVHRDGAVTHVQVKSPSGNPTLDESVVQAVYKAQPLPFLPESSNYQEDTYHAEFTFRYSVKER